MTSNTKLGGKMSCAWETVQDLRDRLDNCTVMYKGQPMRVVDVEARATLVLAPVPFVKPVEPGQFVRVKTSDADLDVSSIELGYCNTNLDVPVKNDCLYLVRYPNRTYKQGIHSINTHIRSSVINNAGNYHNDTIFKTNQGFADSLVGKFPSVNDVDDFFDQGGRCIAVSQELMFKKGNSGVVRLMFRDLEVAWRGPGTKDVFLEDNGMVWVTSKLLDDYGIKVVAQ